MNEKIIHMIEEGLQENFKGNKPFPEWVAALMGAGIVR